MIHRDPNSPDSSGDSIEQQLRRELEELKQQLHAREQHPGPPDKLWKPSGITISVLLLGFAVLLVGAFFAGYVPLEKRDATVRAEAAEHEQALPRMEVIRVGRAHGDSDLKLPGTMQAITEVPILARADGYLKTRLVDIGDHVHAGQPLAEIDAPELDHQIKQAQAAVAQAEAALEQAQANLDQGKTTLELARVTAERYKTLTDQGVVSKQDNDQYQAQFTAQASNVQALDRAISAQRSNVNASKANVSRLQDVQGYVVVKAPFDGVITARNIDVGALVNSGATLLYRIAQTGTLRTYLNVPQLNANSIHVGQAAVLTLTNLPGRRFHGTVTRTANSLDPSTRTMLVEVDVLNSDGALFPGMYADVDLSSPRQNPPLVIPAQALIQRADGAQVAEVDSSGILHLRKIAIGKDYGDRVEILQGVDDGTIIVASPGDAAKEGAKIDPVAAAGAAQP